MSDKKLISVDGLRSADVDTLLVLTSDILKTPVVRYEAETLCDLMALSELEELPIALKRDLDGFREQMAREIADLPDGEPLIAFSQTLADVEAGKVPESLRDAVASVLPEVKKAEVQEALSGLLGQWEGEAPEEVAAPQVVEKTPKKEVVKASKAPAKKKSTRTPANAVDPARAEFIESDILERLSHYRGGNGLKESIICAGSRHRAPWDDVTVKEVMSVLRRLDREKRVSHSAGRWKLR